ncbi:protein ROLLING AND ERECT LEAF 2-like [Nymphaea colorata]|nr:protein ROLLING AND ERECT LEAF 2-like [Nymphaea colorata]
MGACLSSRMGKLGEGDEGDVVALCKERKRLIKATIERRYAFADAHYRYMLSLKAMADACRLFASAHTSPAPLFIALPEPVSSSPPDSPPAAPRLSLPRCCSSSSSSLSSPSPCSSSPDISAPVTAEEAQTVFQPPPPSTFGWDFFFNPFDDFGAKGGRMSRSSDEDLRMVREEEGIPELEEVDDDSDSGDGDAVADAHTSADDEVVVVDGGGDGGGSDGEDGCGGNEISDDESVAKMVAIGKVEGEKEQSQQQRGLTVIDTPARERDLLDALKDVEDHFIRAYDSGKEVCRMLEANRFHLCSGLEEIKESSSKIIHAITWHRSSSSSQCSSSRRSFLSSTDFDSTWKSFSNDLFEECGMVSGSHSLTLDRLFAWEKKLYDEVKAGDQTRRIYERKRLQLSNQEARGDDLQSVDKTRAAVKDLYTRILVAIRAAESISIRIHKLRDEELQPQIAELLEGLMNCWKIMLESHDTQNQIMFEVKSFTSSAAGKFCGDSHRHATLQLENELQNWRLCFNEWIGTQRTYVEALGGWLSKFIIPEAEFCSSETPFPSYRGGGPPLNMMCRKWLASFDSLPHRAVSYSIKSFCRDVRTLWAQQGEEQKLKRKVEGLAKELDRRVFALQKVEKRILESKLSDSKEEGDVGNRIDYLIGRKDLIDMFRRRLDVEKEKHHKCMQETKHVTLNGFQTGLTSVFESLTEFSKASAKMYEELVLYYKKANMAKDTSNPRIEGPKVDVDSG